MKWFYLISLGGVALLVMAPFALLNTPDALQYEGKVVGYNVYTAKVKSMDPATCGDTTSSSIQGSIYEGLYTYHYLKRPLEVIPYLAADLPEISEDHLTYTIPLKEGVLYQQNPCFPERPDGRRTREMVAGDFVLAFKRIADFHINARLALTLIEDKIAGLKEYRQQTRRYREGDFSRYDKEALTGVKALDDHTLQIRLTRPFPQMLNVLAMHLYAPIPREVVDYHLATEGPRRDRRPIPVEQRSAEITDRRAAVGTGPYILTEWIRGGRIVLSRNPDFREQRYPTEGMEADRRAGRLEDAGKRVPFVDAYDFVFVQESNPAWMLFRKKLRDTAGIPRDVFDSVISPSRELTDELAREGVELVKSGYPAVYWFAFNMDDPVVGKSPSLRRALSLAYDVETYIDALYNGRGIPAVNIIPSTFKGHAEAGPGPYYRHDRTEARRLVEQAREELVQAGVISEGEEIPALTMDLGGRGVAHRRIGQFAKNQFDKAGIRLEVRLNDWPTLQEKVHNGTAQIWSMGWHADYPDAENFLQNFYSPNIELGTNSVGYSNPEFDRLFEKASNIMEIEQRVPLYAEMARRISRDVPVLLLSEPIHFTLVHPWVHNFKPHPIAYGLRRYTRLDVEARRRAGGR